MGSRECIHIHPRKEHLKQIGSQQQATLTYEERFALITPEKVYDQLTSTLRQLS